MDNPDYVEVERIYCLDFHSFTEEHWHRLGEIYATLPEFQGVAEKRCPMWFGVDESKAPFLLASVEPPGLHVYGTLQPEQWEEWDRLFRENIGDFPLRKVSGC